MAGFIGIGSAPDFSDELMWKKFPRNIKDIINKKGIYNIKNEYGDPYPITKQFIKDGKKNKILKKFINCFDLPVFLFHGNKDKSVPIKYSRKILKLFKSDNKKLFVIKNGDHSLSRKKNLEIIQKNLKKLINLQI
jgi:esterase/lipase